MARKSKANGSSAGQMEQKQQSAKPAAPDWVLEARQADDRIAYLREFTDDLCRAAVDSLHLLPSEDEPVLANALETKRMANQLAAGTQALSREIDRHRH